MARKDIDIAIFQLEKKVAELSEDVRKKDEEIKNQKQLIAELQSKNSEVLCSASSVTLTL